MGSSVHHLHMPHWSILMKLCSLHVVILHEQRDIAIIVFLHWVGYLLCCSHSLTLRSLLIYPWELDEIWGCEMCFKDWWVIFKLVLLYKNFVKHLRIEECLMLLLQQLLLLIIILGLHFRWTSTQQTSALTSRWIHGVINSMKNIVIRQEVFDNFPINKFLLSYFLSFGLIFSLERPFNYGEATCYSCTPLVRKVSHAVLWWPCSELIDHLIFWDEHLLTLCH